MLKLNGSDSDCEDIVIAKPQGGVRFADDVKDEPVAIGAGSPSVLNLSELNPDFILPKEFKKVKNLG